MDISIVIPLYNKEKYIERTLKRVLEQTYQMFEIIIVNDGSTDNSVSNVNKIKDRRIKLYNQKNSGASNARNNGVKYANGDFIAFLDADDEWDKTYLERIVKLHKNNPDGILYATNYYIMENKELSMIDYPGITKKEGELENYFISGKIYTPIWTSAAVIKKDVFNQLGGFNKHCIICEDVDLWCKIALSGKIYYINEPLAIYHRDNINMLSKNKNASCFYPFLDEYETLINPNDIKKEAILEYVKYRKVTAIKYALCNSNNKEARKILHSMAKKKEKIKNYHILIILSFLPYFCIKKYLKLMRCNLN